MMKLHTHTHTHTADYGHKIAKIKVKNCKNCK